MLNFSKMIKKQYILLLHGEHGQVASQQAVERETTTRLSFAPFVLLPRKFKCGLWPGDNKERTYGLNDVQAAEGRVAEIIKIGMG